MQWSAIAPNTTRQKANVVSLKLVKQTHRPTVATMAFDADTALSVSCFAGGNFCRCWMPAWFQLAELVAAERRAASE